MAMYQEKAQYNGEVLNEIYMQAITKELSNQAWREVWHLDDPKYEILKAKHVELGTADEEHKSMHQKPLLWIYQTDQTRQDKEKKRDQGDKKKNHASEIRGKDREWTCTTKSDKDRKFQNNRDALAGVPQNEIDQHKADKASCSRYGMNSHHMLECFAKKTAKGMELATPVPALTKKGKSQSMEDESDEEDVQKAEPVTKRPKKVAAVTQNLWEDSPELSSWVWEIETSEEELN
jgi:hypothetical protein